MKRGKKSEMELKTCSAQGQKTPSEESAPISSSARAISEQTHSDERGSTSRSTESSALRPPEKSTFYRKTYTNGWLRFMRGKYFLSEAKFVKISADVEDKDSILEEVVKHIVLNMRNLRYKNLLLSVTDCLDLLDDDGRKYFKQDLAKVLSGTCVVTGGIYNGVTKLVGEVVYEFNEYQEMLKDKCPAIGVTNMGRFRNTDSLKGYSSFLDYQIPSASDALEETTKTDGYLDPHHNMFVFVEDSTLNIFGGVIEFRAQVEKRISSEMIKLRIEDEVIHDESVVEIPIVNLVLNGDLDTLKTLTRAIDNGTPSMLIKGSKGVTDCISYTIENTSETDNRHDNISMDSNNGVIKDMLENTDISFDTFSTFQKTCLQQQHLLLVVNLCKVVGKLEEAILDMLKLACLSRWTFSDQGNQRSAVLKTLVATDGFHCTSDVLSTIVCNYLIRDDVEVVERLLQKDVCMDSVLIDAVQFETFYDQVHYKNGLLGVKKLETKLRISPGNKKVQLFMEAIRIMAARPIRGEVSYVWEYFKPSTKVPTEKGAILPYWNYMFLWAVMWRKHDMAKLLWQKVEHPIAMALIATNVCKVVKHHTDDKVLDAEMTKNASAWHSMAVDVLHECCQNDDVRTKTRASHVILKITLPYLNNNSCLDLAIDSCNMEFIEQQACRNLLEHVWTGNILSYVKMFTALICPCLLLCFGANRCTTCCKLYRQLPKKVVAAPKIKFACNLISYVMFLGLFAYVLLFDLPSTVSNMEYVLLTWVLTILLEEMRQMYQTARIHSLKKYFLKGWNSIDLFTICLFLIGFGLRFKNFRDTFDWPRVVLAVDFVAFFFRLVHIFSVHKILGPKLIIIKQMVQDLLYFLVIMAVFILSYSIASFSILFPDSPVNWETARQIIRKPYWHLYGELFLDETEADCTHDASIWKNGTFPRCPSETGRIVVPIMMAVYLLFANILLLNLLIAMFSYTFQKIHEQSDKVWCFHRCYVIREYAMRPFLCPPFNVFWHMYQLIQLCRCRNEGPYDPFHIPYDAHKYGWRDFIKKAVCRYVQSLKTDEAESNDSRIQTANKKLLKTKGEEEEKFRHQAFEALNKKIDDLEKKAERESIELRRIVLLLLEKIDALSKKNDDETKPDTEQQMKERTQM